MKYLCAMFMLIHSGNVKGLRFSTKNAVLQMKKVCLERLSTFFASKFQSVKKIWQCLKKQTLNVMSKEKKRILNCFFWLSLQLRMICYSLVHINESKLLHKTSFLTAWCSLKTDYFDTTSLAPFITLLLTPLKQKLVDYLLHNMSLHVLKKSIFGLFTSKIH